MVCARVNFSYFSPTSYAASLLGEPLDTERHAPRDIVQSASAEGLELDASAGSWRGRVILLT